MQLQKQQDSGILQQQQKLQKLQNLTKFCQIFAQIQLKLTKNFAF